MTPFAPPPPDLELLDLVAEGRNALAAPPLERVAEALRVLPAVVDALDRVAQYQHDVREVRRQLVEAVRAFREAVWAAQKAHPEVTYKGAQVQGALRDVGILLDRLDALLHTP